VSNRHRARRQYLQNDGVSSDGGYHQVKPQHEH
jgi:hypothetical protein